MNTQQAMPSRDLAEYLGVIILSQKDVPQLSDLDLTNLNSSNQWSGASFFCDEQPVILYNKNHSAARTESTIMHELSHIILNHQPQICDNQKHLTQLFRNYDEIHENEASWLGGCLQIPVEGLINSLLKKMTIDQIASQYMASGEMVKYRINVSGASKRVEAILKKKPIWS